MNTKLRRLVPALLLLLGLGLPAAAINVRMPGAMSRGAVRAQVPVIMNAYFASPTPVNGAAFLSALSLTGGDPRINQAVRLRVANVLSAIDIEAARVANAPGAADETNAAAQSNMQGVIAYQAQVLETLQLPHVAQHLTQAQREDITARAAAAGVALTPDKAAALVARAQAEIEKLIVGTRESQAVEAGASGGHVGATPRGAKLGKHAPQDPAALARAAIPSPAALAVHQEASVIRTHTARLAAASGLMSALAVASFSAGVAQFMPLFAIAAAALAVGTLLTMFPATRGIGVGVSRALPSIAVAASAFAAAHALRLFAPPGTFDAVTALILGGYGIAAGRGTRPIMSVIFRAASAVALFAALGAFFPGLPEMAGATIAVASFIASSLLSNKSSAPRGSLLVALMALGAMLSALSGVAIAGMGSFVLWNVVSQAGASALMTIVGGMITGFGLIAIGTLMISVLTPLLMEQTVKLRERTN